MVDTRVQTFCNSDQYIGLSKRIEIEKSDCFSPAFFLRAFAIERDLNQVSKWSTNQAMAFGTLPTYSIESNVPVLFLKKGLCHRYQWVKLPYQPYSASARTPIGVFIPLNPCTTPTNVMPSLHIYS